MSRMGDVDRTAVRSGERQQDTVRIALANVRLPATRDDAVRVATDAIAHAGAAGASLICFPEAYVPGYRWPGVVMDPPDAAWLERAWATVGAAAAASHITVVLGTERVTEAGLQLTAAVFGADGECIGWQDKGQLDPDEESTYPAFGTTRRVFTAGPLTFGVVICHEGWRYPETVRWAVQHGAQLVLHPHAGIAEPGSFRPTAFGDPRNTFHEQAMRCRAAENTCWFASVNAASEGSGTTSAIVRPDGTVHAWQPYGVPGLLLADLDLTLATGHLAQRCRAPYR